MKNKSKAPRPDAAVVADARRLQVLAFFLRSPRDIVGNADLLKAVPALDGKANVLDGDLKYLIEMSLIERAGQGQYRLRMHSPEFVFRNTDYERRRMILPEVKEAVARRLVEDGHLANRCCLITHGTSTDPIFKIIRTVELEKRPEKILTNSIGGILELLGTSSKLTVIGGEVRREDGCFQPIKPSPSRQGSATPADPLELSDYLGTETFNAVVISCSSVSPEGQIMCNDAQPEFRQALLSARCDLFVLADHKKIAEPGGHLVSGADHSANIWCGRTHGSSWTAKSRRSTTRRRRRSNRS